MPFITYWFIFCCFLLRKKKTAGNSSCKKYLFLAAKTPVVELKTPVSTVKLLGGFQVFDKEGVDITDNFTPIVKQILLYLLLNTVKDGKKVTSEKLDKPF